MNNNRLVDARKLQKLVKEFRNEASNATARKHICNVILSTLGDETQTPTVDAVEVCYCKDCKYWEKQKDSAQGCCLLSGNYPTGGWYCADGKRRDEGG